MASRDYRIDARKAAISHGIDPHIFERQISAESNFNPHASSGKAFGIAQFTPETARGMGVNVNDPISSLNGAARLMARYLKQYGNYKDALTAYNAGPGRVGKPLYVETQGYVQKILSGANPGAGGGGTSGGAWQPGGTSSTTLNTFDAAGYAQAQKRALLAKLLSSEGGAKDNPLFSTGLLSTQPVDRTQFEGTQKLTQRLAGHYAGGQADGSAPTAKGVSSFDGKPVAAWTVPDLQYARRMGWKGTVTSGFRSLADQTRIYNSGVRPAAKPGTSNHEGSTYPRGAVDVSNAQQLARILARKHSRLKYAGAKDPVHFSAPHDGGY